MAVINTPEWWLRGPLPGILPALQPVAHALLQAREELNELMHDFPGDLLWIRPAGMASAGFHLQHMTGVLDRLFTYANAQMLSAAQLEWLAAEGKTPEMAVSPGELVQLFNRQVDKTIAQIKITPSDSLFETRGVGRAQLPSTVMGLMVHAAEHSMRHLGQLLVTVKIVTLQAP
jgi:DinB superfamily